MSGISEKGDFKNRLVKIVSLLLLVSSLSWGQSYTVKNGIPADGYDATFENGRLYVLYRLRNADINAPYRFRKLFLSDELKPLDSVDYQLAGKADLNQSRIYGDFVCHLFSTRKQTFIVLTDADGVEVNRITLENSDFKKYFPLSTFFTLGLDFNLIGVSANGSTEPTLLVQPHTTKPGASAEKVFGKICALSIRSGKVLWTMDQPPRILKSLVLAHAVVFLTEDETIEGHPMYALNFYSTSDGHKTAYSPLPPGLGLRDVTTMESNSDTLLLSGIEYKKKSTKNSHLFFCLYNAQTSKIMLDKSDTVDRIPAYRFHPSASLFDGTNHLFMIGEFYKAVPRLLPGISAGVAVGFSPFSQGVYAHAYATPTIRIGSGESVNGICVARMSIKTGEVEEFNSFTMLPRTGLSNFISFDQRAMFFSENSAWIFNFNKLAAPPFWYGELPSYDLVTMVPDGLVLIDRIRKTIVLTKVLPRK